MALKNKRHTFYRNHIRRRRLRQESQIKDLLRIGFALICFSLLTFSIPLGSSYFRLRKANTLMAPHYDELNSQQKTGQTDKKIILAKSKGVEIILPFSVDKLTLVAFHQATQNDVKELKPLGMERKTILPSRAYKAVRNNFSAKSSPYSFVKLIRPGRLGDTNRAIDIGAKEGTKIYAPVSGKVTRVCDYNLYGKYKDTQIAISPIAWPEIELTIFHLKDVAIKEGQRIKSGQDYLGLVRDISVYFKPQLSDYSNDKGNHVHIQINEPRPEEIETAQPINLENLPLNHQ